MAESSNHERTLMNWTLKEGDKKKVKDMDKYQFGGRDNNNPVADIVQRNLDKEQARSSYHKKDPLHGSDVQWRPDVTGHGLANIQPHIPQQLNTDLTGDPSLDGNARISISKRTIKDDTGKLQGVGKTNEVLEYTVVTIIDDAGNPRTFYTRSSAAALNAEHNTSVGVRNHIKIMSPTRWFTKDDLRNAATGIYRGKSTEIQAKAFKGMFGSSVNPDKPIGKTSIATTVLNSLNRSEAIVSGSDLVTDDLLSFKVKELEHLFIPDKFDTTNKTFILGRIEPGSQLINNKHVALKTGWFSKAPISEELRRQYTKELSDAFDNLRQGGGVSYGMFTRDDGITAYGFRVFKMGAAGVGRGDGPELRDAIQLYLKKISHIEAKFLGGGDELAKQLEDAEIQNLRKAYRATDNADGNGVINTIDLLALDVPTTHMEGSVHVTPALVAIAQSAMNRIAVTPGSVQSNVIKRIQTELNSDMATVAKHMSAAYKASSEEFAKQHTQEQEKRGDQRQAWEYLMKAYDPKITGSVAKNFGNMTMRGWTRLTYKKIGFKDPEKYDFVLIPPTVGKDERERIIKEFTVIKDTYGNERVGNYEAESGDRLNVDLLLKHLYDGGAHHTCKVVTDSNNKIGKHLGDVVAAAKDYLELSKDTDSATILGFQRNFGFDENRPEVLNKTDYDRALEYTLASLDERASRASKEFHNKAQAMTAAYKSLYSNGMNTNTAVSSMLMKLGQIYLPAERMTVLFGPSGGLYKITKVPASGRPTIEEIPARIFSKDSLYIRVLKRLTAAANGDDSVNTHLQFTGANAFNFSQQPVAKAEFKKWAGNILDSMDSIRGEEWTRHLRGVALFSNLQGMLHAGFTKHPTGDSVMTTDPALTGMYTKTEPIAAKEFAEQSYKNVVDYMRAYYGEMAVQEQGLLTMNMSPATQEMVKKHFQTQRAEIAERINQNASAWKDLELALDSSMAKMPEARKMAKTIYEIERARMPKTMLSQLIEVMSNTIAKAYAGFVSSIHDIFDLLNPIKIMNSLQHATFDAIAEATRTLFSILFTNFLDRHFHAAPIGKKWAKDVFEKVGVKIMNTEERKLLNKLSGSNQLQHKNKKAEIKHYFLNANFTDVTANTQRLTDAQQIARREALHGPDLALPNESSKIDAFDDPSFDIVWTLKSRGAFETPELGNVDFDKLGQNKNTLNTWWKTHGFDLLFPSQIATKIHSASGYAENIITNKVKETLSRHPSPSDYVTVGGNDIRIRINMKNLLGIDPKEVYGTLADVNAARKAAKSAAATERDLADVERKDAVAEIAKEKKRASKPDFFGGGERVVSSVEPDPDSDESSSVGRRFAAAGI